MRNLMKTLMYTGLLLAFAMVINCTKDTAEKDFDANSALLSVLLEPAGSTQTEAQKACQAAVIKANECIAPGFGFDAYQSCHSSKINSTLSAAEWGKILTAISTSIQTNACNIPHKRYSYHSESVASGAAFDSTTTSTVYSYSYFDSTTAKTVTLYITDALKGKDAADVCSAAGCK